jgi:DNA-directed RNA polymerase
MFGFESYRITSSQGWRDLAGKTVKSNVTVIKGMGDIHTFSPKPIIQSPMVIMEGCNKNFVYYWLLRHKEVFPILKTLYLSSHPCEPVVLQCLGKTNISVYLDESHWRYKNRWAPEANNILKISSHAMKGVCQLYD